MSFTSACPKCGSKSVLLDKMFGCSVRCDECGRKYLAGNEDLAGKKALADLALKKILGEKDTGRNDSEVAEEIRLLRKALTRMMTMQMIYNVAFWLICFGMGIWMWMQTAGKVNNVFQQNPGNGIGDLLKGF